MADFPIFIELESRKIWVIGGGRTATRKVKTLLAFGADIEVWSPEFSRELMALGTHAQIHLVEVKISEDLFLNLKKEAPLPVAADLVICASTDRDINTLAASACRERRIPVNCADSRTDSSFVFPAVIKRGDVVAGISSGVPALTAHLRREIEEAIPEWYGQLAKQLQDYRSELIKDGMADEDKKRLLYQRIRDHIISRKQK